MLQFFKVLCYSILLIILSFIFLTGIEQVFTPEPIDPLVQKITNTFDDGSWKRTGMTNSFRGIYSEKHKLEILPNVREIRINGKDATDSLTTKQCRHLFLITQTKITQIDLQHLSEKH